MIFHFNLVIPKHFTILKFTKNLDSYVVELRPNMVLFHASLLISTNILQLDSET